MIEGVIRRLLDLERRVERQETLEGVPGWTDFTPTLDQGGAVASNVTYGRYAVSGKIAHVQIQMNATGAGTGNNPVTIGAIPAAVEPKQVGWPKVLGVGQFVDSGTGWYLVTVYAESTTEFRLHRDGGSNAVGMDPNMALANGDELWLDCVYEIA